MGTEYLNLLGGDYVQISGAMIRRFGLETSAVYAKLTFYYRGFLTNPITLESMQEFEGKKYFFKDVEEIGLELGISYYKVSNAIKKLEESGLILVQRKKKPSAAGKTRNYYFLTNQIERIMKEDHELQIQDALQAYRLKEEKAGTPAAELELELEKLEEMLRGGAMSNQTAFYKTRKKGFKIEIEKPEAAAAAAAQAQKIEDMLPTGMSQAAEPAPFASEPLEMESEPVPPQQERKPAASRRAAERAAEDRREVMETPGLYEIYTYIQRAYMWNDESIIELCLWLKDSGKHMHISRGDIDKGFIDYANYDKQVSKPARFVGACIEKRLDARLAKQGINVAEVERNLQTYEFIEKFRTKEPDHPMIVKYDAEQREKGFSLV